MPLDYEQEVRTVLERVGVTSPPEDLVEALVTALSSAHHGQVGARIIGLLGEDQRQRAERAMHVNDDELLRQVLDEVPGQDNIIRETLTVIVDAVEASLNSEYWLLEVVLRP